MELIDPLNIKILIRGKYTRLIMKIQKIFKRIFRNLAKKYILIIIFIFQLGQEIEYCKGDNLRKSVDF